MDIRTFFGKTPSPAGGDDKKATGGNKTAKNTPVKKTEKPKKEASKTEAKDTPKRRKKKPQSEEPANPEPSTKKKRLLKRMVLSDSSDSECSVVMVEHTDDVKAHPSPVSKEKSPVKEDEPMAVDEIVVEDDSQPEKENTEKPGSKSVSTWIREQLRMNDPEKLEDLEKDKCSSDNLQTDIQYWCNSEKKLVDPSLNLNKGKSVKVDMSSYLDLLGAPKSHKAIKTTLQDDMLHASPKKEPKSFKKLYQSINTKTEKPADEPVKVSQTPASSPKHVPRKFDTSDVKSPKSPSKRKTLESSVKSEVEETKSPQKEPPVMESLFGSSDSSPYVSPTSSAKRSLPSEESTPKKRKTTKAQSKKSAKKEVLPDEDYVDDGVTGKKFVFTGELTIDRDEAIYRVKKAGGIVVSGVSGQTDYLVYGEKLEDGRLYTTGTKYKKAKELNKSKGLNIQLINEEQFMALLNITAEDKNRSVLDTEPSKDADTAPVEKHLSDAKAEPATSDSRPETRTRPEESMLFEKYRPRKLSDLIGNPKLIERLKDWLHNYDYTSGSKGKGDSFKAALLSGPPGIGKTTCAKLVGESFGYYVMEFNASDQRSKNAIERIMPLVTGTITLNSYQQDTTRDLRKTLLVLDEIDGMSSGDRGGIQGIVKLIQAAKCPIVLICNDRYCQKINALSSKCLDLRFNSPSIELFISRVTDICKRERIPVKENVLLELYHKSNGDMRYTLNFLQFYVPSNYQSSGDAHVNRKDESYSQNIFDNCNKVFNLSKMSYQDKLSKVNELFFTDYNIMSLMLQENYIKYIKNIALLSKLSLTYVCGDLVNSVLHKTQVYSLLPDLSALTAIVPSLEINKASSALSERLSFPQWLGKYSSTNKNRCARSGTRCFRRILGEISMNLSYKSTVYGYNLLLDGYLEIIYQNVMKHLSKENVDECVEYLNEVGVTREMVVDGIANIRFKNQENLYTKISTKVKTQLTKRMAAQLVKVVAGKKSQYGNFDSKTDQDSDSEAKSEDDDKDPLLKKVASAKKRTKAKKK